MLALAMNPKNDNSPNDPELVARMAEAIAGILEKKGSCLPHDLLQHGFTYDEINRLWADAKAKADFQVRISKR